MRRLFFVVSVAVFAWSCAAPPAEVAAPEPTVAARPGTRVLLDAHNCYPYEGRWADRIERALAQGVPLAIEQDLRWYVNPETGEGQALVAHDPPVTGEEPSLREYFFERIRPLMEAELANGDRSRWPVITLNLDFKTEETEHLAYVWNLLGEFEPWLTTGVKSADAQPLTAGPLLVLTGNSNTQAEVFEGAVADGGTLRLFGAVAVNLPPRGDAQDADEYAKQLAAWAPADFVSQPATSYRRWWNNPWGIVEAGGQTKAGPWTPEDQERLRALVDHAHNLGLWMRLYTLNGHDPADESGGWSRGYNFGSLAAAKTRWEAAIATGVDFVATDQYEEFAAVLADAKNR